MKVLLRRNFLIPGIVGLALGGMFYLGSSQNTLLPLDEEEIDKNNRRAITRQMITEPEVAIEESLESQVQRAVDLVDNGETEEAKDLFEMILAKHPNHIRTLLELSLIELLDQGRPDLALPYLVRALRIEPANDHLLGEVADIYVETGNFEEGVEFFKKMLKTLPEADAIQLRIGQLYYYSGSHRKALSHLKKINNSKTHKGQVKSLLARIYLSENQIDRAIRIYAEAEELLETGVHHTIVAGEPGDAHIKWLENLQIEMAEGLINKASFDYAEDILYKLSARIPSDPEVIKLMDLAKVGKRSNAG